MRYFYRCLILFWCGLLPVLAQAQDVLLPEKHEQYDPVERQLNDSLRALYRYAQNRDPAAVERAATGLLTRYPGRVGVPGYGLGVVRYLKLPVYPQQVYVFRAAARQQLGNPRGAEADYTQAVRYGLANARLGNRVIPRTVHQQGLRILHRAYLDRATLRLDQLRDPAGGCADLRAAFQLDTLPATAARWRGCPLPTGRAPIGRAEEEQADQLMLDSLARVRQLLAAQRPGLAEQQLRRLEAGLVGPFAWVHRPTIEQRLLRSELAQQRGDYRRAALYLDTLLSGSDARPAYQYTRGILRIDHLGDQEGGCQDLRWVYDHDSTRTTPAHPRWRGCPLPAHKPPVGMDETKAHVAAYQDSLTRAEVLRLAGQPAQAVQLLSRLIQTGAAGNYAPLIDHYTLPGGVRRSQPHFDNWWVRARARNARSLAYHDLKDYANELAELDTLIQNHDYGQGDRDWFCRRAALRTTYAPDQNGACDDLATCARRGGTPIGPHPWRGCGHSGQLARRELNRAGLVPTLFTNLNYVTPRFGYLRQGRARGAEIGLQWSEEGEPLANYGPSVGVEVAGANSGSDFLVAPKLSYEGELALVGGRLDLAYYLGRMDGRGVSTLRFTPQIGGSLGAYLNVFYGYSVPVLGQRADFLGRHRLSIYINFLQWESPFGKIGG